MTPQSPLVPEDVDLRGLPWMRLDTSRLLDSDLFALSTGDEFKAAVALWCKSWTQSPAASLPNDDRILAYLSGSGTRWRKVKEMALRGWILCADERLYHPVVAEQALVAWEERQEYRADINAQNERQRRSREERAALMADLKAANVHLKWNVPISDVRTAHAKLRQRGATTCEDRGINSHAPVTVTGGGQLQNCHTFSHGLDGTGRDGNISLTDKSSPPHAHARDDGGAMVGVFEGHDDPPPGQRVEINPVARAAIELRRAGIDVTSFNADLADSIGVGVTLGHLLELAAAYPGKPIKYLCVTACRELSEHGSSGSAMAARTAGKSNSKPQTPSKQALAVAELIGTNQHPNIEDATHVEHVEADYTVIIPDDRNDSDSAGFGPGLVCQSDQSRRR